MERNNQLKTGLNLNYYIVTCKCGHVGKNNCIYIKFPVTAESRKVAAEKARNFKRVKHHDKYAIRSVVETDEESFLHTVSEVKENPYFFCKSIQEQRASDFDWSVVERDVEKLFAIKFKRRGRISPEMMRNQKWHDPERSEEMPDMHFC